MRRTGPNLFSALYAAAEYVRDGTADEAEVTWDWALGDRCETITVIVRRYAAEDEPADSEGII